MKRETNKIQTKKDIPLISNVSNPDFHPIKMSSNNLRNYLL